MRVAEGSQPSLFTEEWWEELETARSIIPARQ